MCASLSSEDVCDDGLLNLLPAKHHMTTSQLSSLVWKPQLLCIALQMPRHGPAKAGQPAKPGPPAKPGQPAKPAGSNMYKPALKPVPSGAGAAQVIFAMQALQAFEPELPSNCCPSCPENMAAILQPHGDAICAPAKGHQRQYLELANGSP